jgi:integrase
MASIRNRTPWRLVLEDASRSKIYPTRKQAEDDHDAYYAQGLMGLRVEPVPRGDRYEARVRSKWAPDLVKTFRLKSEAQQWVKEREGEIAKRQFVDYREADRNTLGDLFVRFERERLDGRPADDADKCRIGKLRDHPIALLRMAVLQPSDISAYRKEREKLVKGATVTKELELICRVIGIARAEWGMHMAVNPASARLAPRPKKEPGDERSRRLADSHVAVAPAQRLPAAQPGKGMAPQRKSRRKSEDDAFENDPETDALLKLPQSEQQALLRACRYPHWYTQRKRDVTAATQKARALRKAAVVPVKARQRPGCRIWALTSFAIETAMRRKELCQLDWTHVHLAEGYLDLPGTITKNRKPRIVPLSLRAMRILKTQPRKGALVFATSTNTIKMAFRRARERAASADLRFHDLRHEATSNLFERTDLRANEIGHITGHTDPRTLERYYNKRPQEFVQRFRESFK